MSVAGRLKALEGYVVATSGSGRTADSRQQSELEPGSARPDPPSQSAPPVEPARPYDPGWDKFQADMNQILMRAPAVFMRKLADWNFPSIAEIPINERQGRLDAMRTVCK